MLEFEKKLHLGEGEYRILLSAMGSGDSLLQTNYYYDTPELEMNKSGITLRVRIRNGKMTAEKKHHGIDKGECSLESSSRLEGLPSTFPQLPRTALMGRLDTLRTVLLRLSNVTVFADESSYLGIKEHELEVEYQLGAEAQAKASVRLCEDILRLFGGLGPEGALLGRCGASKSKSERFFERLQMINKAKEIYKWHTDIHTDCQ